KLIFMFRNQAIVNLYKEALSRNQTLSSRKAYHHKYDNTDHEQGEYNIPNVIATPVLRLLRVGKGTIGQPRDLLFGGRGCGEAHRDTQDYTEKEEPGGKGQEVQVAESIQNASGVEI